jgi:Carboxypeptidase regulatory-like domain
VEEDMPGYRTSGQVLDATSETPIPRCVVEIVDVKRGFGSRTMLTGEDGRFRFEGVPASKYRLSASKPGFLTEAYEQHDNFSTATAVGPRLVSENLVFRLTLGAIVSGTVMDEWGEPVRQAQVKLFRDQNTDGLRSNRQQGGNMTDGGAWLFDLCSPTWISSGGRYACTRNSNAPLGRSMRNAPV